MLFDMEMARRESLSKVILNSKREIGKKRSFANRILVNPISKFTKRWASYFISIYIYRDSIRKTNKLKIINTKPKKIVILGSGPSLVNLDHNYLNDIQKAGGLTIAVNHWDQSLCSKFHTPDWLVLVSNVTFDNKTDYVAKKTKDLIRYLNDNENIKVAVPWPLVPQLNSYINRDRVFGFCNISEPVLGGFNPNYPKKFSGSTVFFALAWAKFLGYASCGLIGFDNTYPFDIFVDADNKIYNLEFDSDGKEFLVDISGDYDSVAARLDALAKLFDDFRLFKGNVYNLSKYSLIDQFPNASPSDFSKFI